MPTTRTRSRKVEPVHIGPTWTRGESGGFLLPEFSLGYELAARWIPENLQHPDGSAFQLTQEQARFVVWWYALDERGRFVYRDGVLQRLKGWGKDPLAAVIAAVEFLGPCRFARWEGQDPVGVANPAAWVQVAAVSKDQTRNTMTVFMSLFQPHVEADHRVELGKEIIYAYGGARRIEAVTSSPRALEGGRPTFTVANETQHWVQSNGGHQMWAVIQRNAMKAPNGTSRVLALTNAYDPSEDSVAQRSREAWEKQSARGQHEIMYDSLEAAADAPYRIDPLPDETDEERYDRAVSVIASVIEQVRGDSLWVDPESYAKFVLDSRTPQSEARRFAYNQITATEDAWLDPQAVVHSRAQLEVTAADEWVMFFDGSKSDDSTGVVLCRLSDGHLVTGDVWERPPGRDDWQVDRNMVDGKVRQLVAGHTVVAFFADPSHATDDDQAGGYWDSVIDGWHRDFSNQFKYWSVQAGPARHSVLWDMSSPANQKLFVAAAMAFVEDMEGQLAQPDKPRVITHDGHPVLEAHLRNARKYPTRFGDSLAKAQKDSKWKIDLAVCAVGARMLRRVVLNAGNKGKQPGEFRGLSRWG